MDKFRMRFSKTGRAVYISHLDLMHTFQRGFSRAGYELKYSEGFNPHPIISIVMPLSVGTSSVCELMDFRLKEDKPFDAAALKLMAEKLTDALPEGINVQCVYEPVRKTTDLKWLQVEGTFQYDAVPDAARLRELFSRKEITVTKKTKHGTAEINLSEGIRTLKVSCPDTTAGTGIQNTDAINTAAADAGCMETGNPNAVSVCTDSPVKKIRESDADRQLVVNAVVSAQNPTINPELLVEALQKYCPELAPDFHSFRRVEVYDAEMKPFT